MTRHGCPDFHLARVVARPRRLHLRRREVEVIAATATPDFHLAAAAAPLSVHPAAPAPNRHEVEAVRRTNLQEKQ